LIEAIQIEPDSDLAFQVHDSTSTGSAATRPPARVPVPVPVPAPNDADETFSRRRRTMRKINKIPHVRLMGVETSRGRTDPPEREVGRLCDTRNVQFTSHNIYYVNFCRRIVISRPLPGLGDSPSGV
jgi:hypothetical protein